MAVNRKRRGLLGAMLAAPAAAVVAKEGVSKEVPEFSMGNGESINRGAALRVCAQLFDSMNKGLKHSVGPLATQFHSYQIEEEKPHEGRLPKRWQLQRTPAWYFEELAKMASEDFMALRTGAKAKRVHWKAVPEMLKVNHAGTTWYVLRMEYGFSS